MTSAAAATFTDRIADISVLMEIHKEIGHGPGNRGNPGPRVEVLNRSAVVLTTAIWEGYCEEVAAEGLRHLVDHVADPNKLPKKLREQVAKELFDLHPASAWKLAGDGWRQYLSTRLADYAAQTALNWNTPMSDRVDSLFKQSIGLEKVTDSWKYLRRTADDNRTKIDGWVRLRGGIAHGAGAPKKITKSEVTNYRQTVKQLIVCTDAAVSAYVLKETGVPLF